MFKLKSREAGRVGEDVEIMELLTKILEEQTIFKDSKFSCEIFYPFDCEIFHHRKTRVPIVMN